MTILDLKTATELGQVSAGSVLIASPPQIRQGKHNEFMVGNFTTPEGTAEFKIWEERTFAVVRDKGPGIYDVEVEGSEYNGIYLTVRRIQPTSNPDWIKSDFLPTIPREQLTQLWQKVRPRLQAQGVTDQAWQLLEAMLADPQLEGRYVIEGAAIYYHDNRVGGLLNHTGKMLNILAAVLENLPALQASADLLFLGIALHDLGKVFEYRDLGLGEYWYANHRIRGIEFIAGYKDEIITTYDEAFYRQLQTIIMGHHGDYGDRPTTVAAGIVHYIDTLESQTTSMLESQAESQDGRLRFGDWGWLQGIPVE